MTLTVTFDLLQGQICCRAGDHNSLNVLVYFHYTSAAPRREEGGKGAGGEGAGGEEAYPLSTPSCMY